MHALLALLSPALAGPVFLSADEARAVLSAGAVLIDARGHQDHARGHLPGAQPLSWTRLRDGALQVGRLTDDMGQLQATFRGLGLDPGEPVVIYDAGREGWGEAGRIWWTLDYLGHAPVYILDGGLPAWAAAGGTVEAGGAPAVEVGAFAPRPDETARARLSEVSLQVEGCRDGACGVVFWDTREAREFAGETPYGEDRGGHLPGAVGLHYQELLDAQGRLLPRDQLQGLLSARGITPDKQIVPYCTGGVRSGFAAAVLTELGYPRVANYDGSMWEWSSDPARPLE